MALTIEVRKVSVSEQIPKLWNITLNLRCTDNEVEVINQNFIVKYRPGQDIEIKVKELQEEMQKTINVYKDEQQVFTHVKLDNAITWLQNNLEG